MRTFQTLRTSLTNLGPTLENNGATLEHTADKITRRRVVHVQGEQPTEGPESRVGIDQGAFSALSCSGIQVPWHLVQRRQTAASAAMNLKEVEILPNEAGVPEVTAKGTSTIHLSLSHSNVSFTSHLLEELFCASVLQDPYWDASLPAPGHKKLESSGTEREQTKRKHYDKENSPITVPSSKKAPSQQRVLPGTDEVHMERCGETLAWTSFTPRLSSDRLAFIGNCTFAAITTVVSQ